MAEPKALAFDIDGTFYASSSVCLKNLRWCFENLRLLAAFFWTRRVLRKKRPIVDFYTEQTRLCSSFLSLPVAKTEDLIRSKIYESWDNFMGGVRLRPNLKEVLLELKGAGYRLGVLSDFPLHPKLDILGLSGIWDFELCSERTGYLKPNPEPFAALAEGLGVTPGELLYVGNSYVCDVRGALGAGMAAAHLSIFPWKESKKIIKFHKFSSLRNLLLKKY